MTVFEKLLAEYDSIDDAMRHTSILFQSGTISHSLYRQTVNVYTRRAEELRWKINRANHGGAKSEFEIDDQLARIVRRCVDAIQVEAKVAADGGYADWALAQAIRRYVRWMQGCQEQREALAQEWAEQQRAEILAETSIPQHLVW